MTAAEPTLRAAFAGRLGRFALDAVFEVPLHGVTGLFGPSGSGKTVLLRCIAGLTRLRGALVVGGEVWEDTAAGVFRAPHERPVGYVFQEASLFPHLSVSSNLLYGHRRALRRGAETIRVDEVIELLGVGHLLDRSPLRLSGGERQRVSLGRALLSQPRLLLMDEPLSALDRTAKEEIIAYLEAVQLALSIPVLYVSHDIGEVERLANHLVLLEAGAVVTCGPLSDVLADPRSPIALGPSAATILEARLQSFDPGDVLATLEVDGGRLLVPGPVRAHGAGAHGAVAQGAVQRIRIAADDVSLAVDRPSRSTILNVLAARIQQIEPIDAGRVNVLLRLGEDGEGARLLARITRRSCAALELAPGQRVHAQVKGVSIVDPRRPAPEESRRGAGERSRFESIREFP